MRIKLNIPIGAFTGYGRDGIGLSRALMKLHHDVTLGPVTITPPIPREVAMLLTKYPETPQDLVIDHLPPGQLGIPPEDRGKAHKHIAWSMWEYCTFPEKNREAVAARLETYDHVFAYDETSLKSFVFAKGNSDNMSILQGGYEPEPWRSEVQRDWYSDELRVCMLGDLGPRKDPYVAVEVVRELREEGMNIRLFLKSTGNFAHPAFKDYCTAHGTTIIEGEWADSQIKAFYESCHVYLSTSWGEGKNLPALEAGTTGCALIISDCGGHRQWGYPNLADFIPGEWFEHKDGLTALKLSKDVVKEHLTRAYNDRQRLRHLGEQAAMQLPVMMSWDAVVQRLFTKL